MENNVCPVRKLEIENNLIELSLLSFLQHNAQVRLFANYISKNFASDEQAYNSARVTIEVLNKYFPQKK